jgi:hypothetical protein
MNGKLRPPPNDADWAGLLDVERCLEADIAAAQAEARERLAQARLTTESAAPNAGALAALAATQEQADNERQRSEIAQIAEHAAASERGLTEAPASLIDALARLALDAVLTDRLALEDR